MRRCRWAFQTARRCWPRATPSTASMSPAHSHLPAGPPPVDRRRPSTAREHRSERPAERRTEERDAGHELHPAEMAGARDLRPKEHRHAECAERHRRPMADRAARSCDGSSQRSTRRNQMGRRRRSAPRAPSGRRARPGESDVRDAEQDEAHRGERGELTAADAPPSGRASAQQASISDPEIVNLTPARKTGGTRSNGHADPEVRGAPEDVDERERDDDLESAADGNLGPMYPIQLRLRRRAKDRYCVAAPGSVCDLGPVSVPDEEFHVERAVSPLVHPGAGAGRRRSVRRQARGAAACRGRSLPGARTHPRADPERGVGRAGAAPRPDF